MEKSGKFYFASDMHLGVPSYAESLAREKKLVLWLDFIRQDAEAIYLLGDIFDFWFEYKKVVPRGYTRLLGKLAELTDSGTPVHILAGNHDMWYGDYFPKELGVQVHHQPLTRHFFGKKVFLAHGDGLGPGDYGYKLLKFAMRNALSQWCFAHLPPRIGINFANFFSKTSRHAQEKKHKPDAGYRDYIHAFARDFVLRDPSYDYFICGHIHSQRVIPLNDKSTLILLGDWISDFAYIEFSETALLPLVFDGQAKPIRTNRPA